MTIITALKLETIVEWDATSNAHVKWIVKELYDILSINNITDASIVDVGSNIGKFTGMLSEHITITDAILIEPIIELLEYSKTKYPNFHFENLLVSNTAGFNYIYTPLSNLTNLGLSRIVNNKDASPNPADIREMPTTTLTILLADKYPTFAPTVVKVDAEGTDIQVVEGLFDYLITSDHRPIIIFECSANTDPTAVVDQFKTLGYRYHSSKPLNTSRDIFLLPENIKTVL